MFQTNIRGHNNLHIIQLTFDVCKWLFRVFVNCAAKDWRDGSVRGALTEDSSLVLGTMPGGS